MAVRTAAPWWFSALFAFGLACLFLGERLFGDAEGFRYFASGLGVFLVVATTGLRVVAMKAARGDRRRVEATLLLCQIGALAALGGYLLTTEFGRGLIGQSDLEGTALHRYTTVVTILWAVIMGVSLLPMLMIEIALGLSFRGALVLRNAEFTDDGSVESERARTMAWSGVNIALAAAFLMVTCEVSSQRNLRKDYSYFKTSSPGSATVKMARSVSDGLKVVLFFPEVNEVKDEVRGYFEQLSREADTVSIEFREPVLDRNLAKEYGVNDDGVIVIVRDDPKLETKKKKRKQIKLGTQLRASKGKQGAQRDLRKLDGKVQKALMELIRDRRYVYMTVGHGEINDPDSVTVGGAKNPLAKTKIIKDMLTKLNYQVRDLKLSDDVPDDATIVMMLGPTQPLHEGELQRLDAYLAQGGSMLIALESDTPVELGALEGRLGVRFQATPLADSKAFYPTSRRNISDRRNLVTNQFTTHASITTLAQRRSKEGLVVVSPGSLIDAAFAVDTKPKRTYVARSMATAFDDANKNYTLDKDSEKAKRYNLVAAIEDPKAGPQGSAAEEDKDETKPKNSKEKVGMRAVVVADSDVFMDYVQGFFGASQRLFHDAVKWLGGEESFSGTTKTEEDRPIKHSKREDAVYFFVAIIGAPVLIVILGLIAVGLRRRPRRS